ncbi:hypothetical protein D3C77_105980 [compost metagenome]
MAIDYPSGLPLGLHSGRTYQVVSPLMRTQMTSGRAKQRRRYGFVPEMAQIQWLFNNLEGQAFEGWWRDQLLDGALWFSMILQTPLGLSPHDCRFTGVYTGPTLVGPDLWQYSAELELRERAVVPEGDGLFPDDILYSEIFDLTINREMPPA